MHSRSYGPEGFRYTAEEFPPYRHLPGVTPHPRRHPKGHLYGKREVAPPPFVPRQWQRSQDYLYGVDLYNFAYYWEAHEAWEGIWKSTGRVDLPGRYLQGLIQLTAAMLKREQRQASGMHKLAQAGLAKLNHVAAANSHYCGVNLPEFIGRLQSILTARDLATWPADPRIYLETK